MRICGNECCDVIMAMQLCSSNAHFYSTYTRHQESVEQSESRRSQNHYKHVAHDSHTPYTYLTEEQMKERLRNLQMVEMKCGCSSQQLEEALKVEADPKKHGNDASK